MSLGPRHHAVRKWGGPSEGPEERETSRAPANSQTNLPAPREDHLGTGPLPPQATPPDAKGAGETLFGNSCWPRPGGSNGWCIALMHRSSGFDPRSGHMPESTSEWVNERKDKSLFLNVSPVVHQQPLSTGIFFLGVSRPTLIFMYDGKAGSGFPFLLTNTKLSLLIHTGEKPNEQGCAALFRDSTLWPQSVQRQSTS